jgi:PEGA domain-containing protein
MRYLLGGVVALTCVTASAPLSAWGSKKVSLTIHSTPEGAMVTENGKSLGYTPITLVYTFSDFRSCRQTQPVTVQWVSGATASVTSVQLCPAIGKNQSFTFERPTTPRRRRVRTPGRKPQPRYRRVGLGTA